MIERPRAGERALLVIVDFGAPGHEDSAEEFTRLAQSADLQVLGSLCGKRARPDAAFFIGRGKVEELAARVAEQAIDVVLFNHPLSPAQERNLERQIHCRVVDRVSLILDIFASRAQSAEGKLQVELAQLQHLSTRLVRGWTHLERQKGGIGLRGPGETQLETDRRLLGLRVKALHARLAKLARQRGTQRRARARNRVLTVALVGYTNAGKSTLFNSLTRAGVYVADQLFATLDTTSRRLYLEAGRELVLADTVGFISSLPHELIAAFRATLEATREADLLLHVIDASSPTREMQRLEVNKVLAEIGADQVPQWLIMNKIDLTEAAPGGVPGECDTLDAIRVSAKTGAGLPVLRSELTRFHRTALGRADAPGASLFYLSA
jgi:GTP-binding protein HflX